MLDISDLAVGHVWIRNKRHQRGDKEETQAKAETQAKSLDEFINEHIVEYITNFWSFYHCTAL